ncbi:Aquaporin-9 [Chionoecetes opilio]|uniref:Aquaporin-9 n=1 Tax=Chionoecetes opilio TaxID=41210 RepID=A0A8J5BVH9_CHIOP|nr:Aquaporin-9 [Chionoecetes opilio]
MAIWGKHPWQKVPVYIVAQYLGAFFASALVYGVYLNALDGFEAERSLATAGIWATYPGAITARNGTVITDYLSSGNGLADQVVGTMLLLVCVCAITDTRNMEVPKGLVPLLVGLSVLNIGVCFGFNCGYAINPARDLAPRIFTLIAGWGSDTFSAATIEGVAWWWVPVVGPHIGAVLGVTIYEVFVGLHHPEAKDFTLPQVAPYPDSGTTKKHLAPRRKVTAAAHFPCRDKNTFTLALPIRPSGRSQLFPLLTAAHPAGFPAPASHCYLETL